MVVGTRSKVREGAVLLAEEWGHEDRRPHIREGNLELLPTAPKSLS